MSGVCAMIASLTSVIISNKRKEEESESNSIICSFTQNDPTKVINNEKIVKGPSIKVNYATTKEFNRW